MSETRAIATTPELGAIERLVAMGDLSRMTEPERMAYYRAVCDALGLNPLTQPFSYITLSGKLVLYARKDCADQLRKLHSVTIAIVSQSITDEIALIHVRASAAGRSDEDFGAVNLTGLRGEARCNAIMKAITKAKRRVTLSICGLGFLDETEVADIPQAEVEQPRQAEPPKQLAAPAPAPNPVSVLDRVKALDSRLAEANICTAGDLMARLNIVYGDIKGAWPEDAIDDAKAFSGQLKEEQVGQLLDQKGTTWLALAESAKIPLEPGPAGLMGDNYRRVIDALQKMPDAAPAKKGAKK